MKALFSNRWLTIAGELFVGGFFLYACYDKIKDPPGFVSAIYNYKMTPCSVINGMAIYLPYLEALTGAVMVLSGLLDLAGKAMPLRRGAAALTVGMLLLFMTAIGFNIARGHAIECGCTSVPRLDEKPKSREQLLSAMWFDLAIRDLGLLVLTVQVLAARTRSCGSATPAKKD